MNTKHDAPVRSGSVSLPSMGGIPLAVVWPELIARDRNERRWIERLLSELEPGQA